MASRPGRQIGKVRGLKSRCSRELAGSIPAPGMGSKVRAYGELSCVRGFGLQHADCGG